MRLSRLYSQSNGLRFEFRFDKYLDLFFGRLTFKSLVMPKIATWLPLARWTFKSFYVIFTFSVSSYLNGVPVDRLQRLSPVLACYKTNIYHYVPQKQ